MSATLPNLRSPWREFLTEVDRLLPGPVRLHCLGGFVTAMQHGLTRPTNDLDYIEVVPHDTLHILQELTGPQSELARKYGLYFQISSCLRLTLMTWLYRSSPETAL